MLIENTTAQTVAEKQLILGFDLARLANDAFGELAKEKANYGSILKPTLEDRDMYDFAAALDAARQEVTVRSMHFRALCSAAGELIGRLSLGGDLLAQSTGATLLIHDDGSYVQSALND